MDELVRCGLCSCTPCMCGVPGFVTYRGYTLSEALASVGAGWGRLIAELFTDKPEGCIVTQVKEKFGGLRFYINGGTAEYNRIVHRCESESFKVCESCGEPGAPMTPDGNPHGWIKTVCPACGTTDNYMKPMEWAEWEKERVEEKGD